MTMIRGDHHWARLWVAHYTKQVQSRRDLYVILHGTDPELEQIFAGCSVLHVPIGDDGSQYFEQKRLDFEHFFIRGLQAYFTCVLMVDIDEFVTTAPEKNMPLWQYLPSAHGGEMVRSCLGFEVVDPPDAPGPPLDLSQKILRQRPLAYCNAQYSKPCAFYFNFGGGTHHRIFGAPWIIDPNLLLFHMRYCDRGLRRQYLASRKAYYKEQVNAGLGQSGNWRFPAHEFKRLMKEIKAFPGGDLTSERREELRLLLLKRLADTNTIGRVASGLLTLPEDMLDLV